MEVGIIGAGASGMMAAVAAAGNHAKVTLIEKNARIGKKILATGNGKCNFTNKSMSDDDYFGQQNGIYTDYISQFDQNQVISFFLQEGMLVKDRNGYCYPRSEQASTVLDIFRYRLREEGVNILTDSSPLEIKKTGKRFVVKLLGGQELKFDRLILACGSFAGQKHQDEPSGYTYAKKFGHSLVPVVPALVQVKARGNEFAAVAGVRCDAALQLSVDHKPVAKERGELQLTDYGISGIVVFQLSRHISYAARAKKQMDILIDLLPEYSPEEWEDQVKARIDHCRKAYYADKSCSAEEFFTGILNKKLNLLFLKKAGIKPTAPVTEVDPDRLLDACMQMKCWRVEPEAPRGMAYAQVCAGGVPLRELTLQMESTLVKGLYFAGEMIDVDGKCGGYNLQWAWTSGYLAGDHASRDEKKDNRS
jgi:hypothetical protein